MGKFRLNAPQTESDFDVEGSMPFGNVGDRVEHPGSEEFHNSSSNVNTNNNAWPQSTGGDGSQRLHNNNYNGVVSLAGAAVGGDGGADGRLGIGHGEMKGSSNNNTTTTNNKGKEEEQPKEAAAAGDAAPTGRSMRWMITIGVVSVILLVALIVAVSVAMTRANNNNDNNKNGGDSSTDSSNSGSGGGSSGGGGTDGSGGSGTDAAGPSSDTTLGRIYNEGILRCGVPIEQSGFAITNSVTGRMDGFDADLCRAVAAGIFGPANLDYRVEYIPVNAFDRWSALKDGQFDVLARVSTHTMEREVLEVRPN